MIYCVSNSIKIYLVIISVKQTNKKRKYSDRLVHQKKTKKYFYTTRWSVVLFQEFLDIFNNMRRA